MTLAFEKISRISLSFKLVPVQYRGYETGIINCIWLFPVLFAEFYRRIHADVIVYIFAHLHTALRIEGNMLDMN